MTKVDWGYACLSLAAALTLGLAVGLSVHWGVGLGLSVGLFSAIALTEGFRAIQDVPHKD